MRTGCADQGMQLLMLAETTQLHAPQSTCFSDRVMTTPGAQKQQLELEMMVVVVHRAAMGSNRCCPSPKLVIVIVDTSGNLMAAMLPSSRWRR